MGQIKPSKWLRVVVVSLALVVFGLTWSTRNVNSAAIGADASPALSEETQDFSKTIRDFTAARRSLTESESKSQVNPPENFTSTAIVGDPVLGAGDPILGSKHDFTGLNARAGVVAMAGVAFSDYGYSCVYCHIPPEEAGALPSDFGGIKDWNRFVPATENYQFYSDTGSHSLDTRPNSLNPISMLCLSCHDGTMAVDMIVFKPATFDPQVDSAMHMRINDSDNIESCGKCHNGDVAHDISVKVIGTDLRNDHPISMRYAGLDFKDPDFRPPDTPTGFNNGVKLYDGKVECMSCHNVHDPSKELLLREDAEVLCFTCHLK